MHFPLFVKPAYEGSSKGVGAHSLAESPDELVRVVGEMQAKYRQPILVEEFIGGDEVTVGVLGGDPPRVLGLMRVLPREPVDRFIYSIESKREWRRLIHYETPAQIRAEQREKIEQAALAAYRVLGCRDVARVDFRMKDGEPYFLEANPLPGLHPENSDLVMIAHGVGISHAKLVQTIFRLACERQHLASGP